jgi:hypothetical protein
LHEQSGQHLGKPAGLVQQAGRQRDPSSTPSIKLVSVHDAVFMQPPRTQQGRRTAPAGATIAFLESDRPEAPRAGDAYGERLSEYRS